MITQVQAGPYTVRGISVGGMYTTLQVPELDVVLDVGVSLRSFATAGRFFLSHGHLDHFAGLAGILNIRGLLSMRKAQVHLPAEIEEPVRTVLKAHTALSRSELEIDLIPMLPGDERSLGHGLYVRALRTHHPVPSLGYQFLRRVNKLRPEHQGKSAEEIARLRKEGATDLFEQHEQLELAYATDTLSRVLETSPLLLKSRVLVMECTFVDPQRSVEDARRKAHVHLDELAALAPKIDNEVLVLMHFSLTVSPNRVREVVRARLPPELYNRVVIFAPEGDRWWG